MMYSGEHPPPPPNYVMLTPQYGPPPPPYYQPQPYYQQRRVPHYYGSNRSGGSCCLRCICFCYCLLFMLIFVTAAALFLTYTFYQPRIPIYKLQDFSVKTFNIQPDMVLNVEFMVTVLAQNPNTKIGFIYGEDSLVTVSFENSELCRGKVPSFLQGHENVTLIQIPLSGKSSFGMGLQESFMSQQQQGYIPLLIQVSVPVTIVVNNNIPMRQFVLHLNCHMAVDDLRPDKKPRILSTSYTFGFGK